MLFSSHSIIQSATLFKQSVFLSKHVNPPTSSLFPWTLAPVCQSAQHTNKHAHTCSPEGQQHQQACSNKYPFLHIQVRSRSDNPAGTLHNVGRNRWIFSLEIKINKAVRRLPSFVVLLQCRKQTSAALMLMFKYASGYVL